MHYNALVGISIKILKNHAVGKKAESQNRGGWNGLLEIIYSSPPAKADSLQ